MNKNESYYYNKIDYAILTLINSFKGKRVDIAIYPYGYVGQYTKKILNDVYGIEEAYIFDKKISKYNKRIKWFDNFDKDELRETAVIVACENVAIYDEVWNTCKEYFAEENIFSVFSKVCIDRDTRIETLKLNAEYLEKKKVRGNVAELGVYNGDFSKEINKYFKDKVLYMFDTFEGFHHEQIKNHVDNKFMAALDSVSNHCRVNDYRNILQKFKYPENCVIMQGYFPDSAIGKVEDTFCFVSIDVDIYSSTKAGLEFFWPRMEKNGIIMIHDYNCNETLGVKRAVDEFATIYDARIVMISDSCGSVIMVK